MENHQHNHFKTKQQLETENALKTMREWEEYLKWEDALALSSGGAFCLGWELPSWK